ncbi:MAG: hypothetical protein AAGB93_13710, partial [Planctomycetota bacterium]
AQAPPARARRRARLDPLEALPMHVRSVVLPVLASLVAGSVPAAAQRQPDVRALLEQASGQERPLHWDVDRHGVLWVRGSDYKARATPGGFRFFPFLGSDAPRLAPATFRLASAELGGLPLELADAAEVSRHGDRVVLDHGAVVVRYDCATDSVEQSFAVTLPEGAGDLVLRLEVETELTRSAKGGGFRFANERGGVDYGASVAILADGERADVPARAWGAGIELTVPADVVDRARGALVVDPILSTFIIDDWPLDLGFPDVAYDAVRDRYCVVYQEQFAGPDIDVYSIFVDGTTGASTGGDYVDISSERWAEPAVASLRASESFMVVALVDGAGPLPRSIGARTRSAVDGLFAAPFILKGGTASYFCDSVDIGGASALGALPSFAVVYERRRPGHSDVAFLRVDAAGNWLGSEEVLADNPVLDEERPRISKSTGSDVPFGRWIVTWHREHTATGLEGVYAQAMSTTGAPATGPIPVFFAAPGERIDWIEPSDPSNEIADVNGQQYFVVAFQYGQSPSEELVVALCAGDQVLGGGTLAEFENEDLAVGRRGAGVVTFRDAWMVTYVEMNASTGFLQHFGTIVRPVADRLGIEERRIEFTDGTQPVTLFAGASARSGGAADARRDALQVWSVFSGATYDIHGAIVESESALSLCGFQVSGCVGNPNSTGRRGFLRAIGDRTTTADKTLYATDLPANAAGMFLASQATNTVVFPGGSQGVLCLGGSIGRFGLYGSGPGGEHMGTVGPGAIAQPTGAISALTGETWFFQSWHRDAVGGAATSNFTNAVGVAFQ